MPCTSRNKTTRGRRDVWLLLIPAAVIAWFLLLVALGTAISRHDLNRCADDRRMIRHLRTRYPQDESGNNE